MKDAIQKVQENIPEGNSTAQVLAYSKLRLHPNAKFSNNNNKRGHSYNNPNRNYHNRYNNNYNRGNYQNNQHRQCSHSSHFSRGRGRGRGGYRGGYNNHQQVYSLNAQQAPQLPNNSQQQVSNIPYGTQQMIMPAMNNQSGQQNVLGQHPM